jgi:HD superfamily phosphohydrolase
MKKIEKSGDKNDAKILNETFVKSDAKNSEKILHEKFSEYGRNAKEWLRKCALLLPEIERRRIWEKKGFSNIYEYAGKLANMSRYQVNEALRVLRGVENKPELKKVVEEKGINAVKPVLTVATEASDRFWAEKASKMSKHALETYVQEYKKSGLPGKSNAECSESGLPRKSVVEEKMILMTFTKETAEQLEKLKGEESWEELMKEFLKMREEKLEAEKPEKVITKSRPVPAKIEKHIVKRCNKKCEFPNCKKPYKILHHVDRYALKKEHDPDKIFALCEGHERLFHQSLIENEEKGPRCWRIRLEADRSSSKYQIDCKVMEYRSYDTNKFT